MAVRLVNKVFHELNDSADVSLEPLNEIYFGRHPMLSDLDKAFAQMFKEADKLPQLNETSDDKQDWNKLKFALRAALMSIKATLNIRKIVKEVFGFEEAIVTIPVNDESGYGMAVYTHADEIVHTDNMPNKEYIDRKVKLIKTLMNIRKTQKTLTTKEERYDKNISKKQEKYMRWYDRVMQTYVALNDEIPRYTGTVLGFTSKIDKKRIDSDFYDAKQCIIIDENGIRFDKNVIKKVLRIDIDPATFIKIGSSYRYTPRMLTAALLHEIGHVFTSFIIKNVNHQHIRSKADEMFADQFVVMHGYGADLAESFEETLRAQLQYSYIKDIYSDRDNNIKRYNYMIHTRALDKNEHPFIVNRIYRIIDQMKADSRDPDLSSIKKQQLQNDINQAAQVLKRLMNPEKYYGVHANSFDYIHKIAQMERQSNSIYQKGAIDADFDTLNTELRSRMIKQSNR